MDTLSVVSLSFEPVEEQTICVSDLFCTSMQAEPLPPCKCGEANSQSLLGAPIPLSTSVSNLGHTRPPLDSRRGHCALLEPEIRCKLSNLSPAKLRSPRRSSHVSNLDKAKAIFSSSQTAQLSLIPQPMLNLKATICPLAMGALRVNHLHLVQFELVHIDHSPFLGELELGVPLHIQDV